MQTQTFTFTQKNYKKTKQFKKTNHIERILFWFFHLQHNKIIFITHYFISTFRINARFSFKIVKSTNGIFIFKRVKNISFMGLITMEYFKVVLWQYKYLKLTLILANLFSSPITFLLIFST